MELGETKQDIKHDYRRGFIKFPTHESYLPGHVYNAVEVAADHGIHHILDDVGRLVSPKVHADYLLGRAFASPTLERAKYVFNDVLKCLRLVQTSCPETLRLWNVLLDMLSANSRKL